MILAYCCSLSNDTRHSDQGLLAPPLVITFYNLLAMLFVVCREKNNTPSGFTLKLRKHIRTRRLEDVRQLGYDRVGILFVILFQICSIYFMVLHVLSLSLLSQIILFQFGLGANAFYVILELYAQGNIILTDSDFMVLTLLRSHRYIYFIYLFFLVTYQWNLCIQELVEFVYIGLWLIGRNALIQDVSIHAQVQSHDFHVHLAESPFLFHR